jgi:DNA-binding response OmpR family regulator
MASLWVCSALPELPSYRDEHLHVDLRQQLVILDGQILTLTRQEYRLLALLVEHAGEVVPRAILLMRVWGYAPDMRTRTLDVHIRWLRKKLGMHAGQYIETVVRVGYRFRPPVPTGG